MFTSVVCALVSTAPESRVEKKERTRRAILEAALRLSEEGGLSALSLRQVAREVGVVPTAFYRHFASIDELGLALVDESFASLRTMLRQVRQGRPAPAEIIRNSVNVLADHVRDDPEHYAFLVRERRSGPRTTREAVRLGLQLVESELATDLARITSSRWSTEDLQLLANLLVGTVVSIVDDLLESPRPSAEKALRERAERQLRMIVVGVLNWQSDHKD